ncbi:hypothetical protein I4U23_018244 [Adineta vaga]|nr:hypothetical protein I4U23_018244 [Adineta vaga]
MINRLVTNGNDEESKLNQLIYPTDMIIDQENRRVIRCKDQKQCIIITVDIDYQGLALDKNRFLYLSSITLSDLENHRVVKWKQDAKEGIGYGKNPH